MAGHDPQKGPAPWALAWSAALGAVGTAPLLVMDPKPRSENSVSYGATSVAWANGFARPGPATEA